jgi:hypothetical protein
MLGEAVDEELLDGRDDGGMQRAAMGRQQREVGDLPDPVVGEIEALARRVQHPPPDQLLETLGGVMVGEAGRAVKELELELAPDDGGHARQLAPARTEAVETAGNHIAHPTRQRQAGRTPERLALADCPHGLDHDERIPSARLPHLLGQLRPGGRRARSSEEPDQRQRLVASEPRQHQTGEPPVLQLVERAAKDRAVGHLLLANADRDQDWRLVEAATEEREEPEAHLVRPVDVLEHEDERLLEGEMPKQSNKSFEQAQGIAPFRHRRQVRGEELRKQPRELGDPDGFQSVQGSRVCQDAALPERVDPGPERQDLFTLVGAAEQDAPAPAFRLGGQIGEEPALADAGLAEERHDLTVSGPRRSQGLVESNHLGASTD